jgi:hypothetical protein
MGVSPAGARYSVSMDAAGARALARRIEAEGRRPAASEVASPSAPRSSWRERVPRPLRRNGFFRGALESWTAVSPPPSPPAGKARPDEPARIVIRRLERPANVSAEWLAVFERERRVWVEGRAAVVTELVYRKSIDGEWKTVVVDSRIAYRR